MSIIEVEVELFTPTPIKIVSGLTTTKIEVCRKGHTGTSWS